MKMRAAIEWLVAVILILAACAFCWLIGDVCGIQYQRDLVKLPAGNGVANYYKLDGEKEIPLNPLSENQLMAVILLMNEGSVECWISNETGEAITDTMAFDRDGSFVFSVPSDGVYAMMIRGDQASFNMSMTTYDRE